jgi:hypothetical protein
MRRSHMLGTTRYTPLEASTSTQTKVSVAIVVAESAKTDQGRGFVFYPIGPWTHGLHATSCNPMFLISLRTLFLGRHALGNPFEYILTLLVYNHVLRLNLVTRQWNLVDNYGDIPGVRMGMYYFSMSLCALLIGIHRTHCMLMAGQQAPSLRWRERAPPTSRRCHRIRPQDSTLDATRAPRPNTARPSPSFRSHLR